MNPSVSRDFPAANRWHAGSRRCLVAALACGVTGCIIPTPWIDSGAARHNIRKETPGQFQPGRTTRAEVMLALGEPDAVAPDERKLAYRSEKICAIWLVGGSYSGGGGSLEKDDYLVFQFDAGGRLRKTERSSHWLTSAALDRKLGTTAPAASRRDAGIRTETRANWLSGVDDFKARGVTEAKWVPGKLVLTASELRFFSRSKFANAPPIFILPYTTITEASEDKLFIGSLLAVRTRTGKHYAFQIQGDSAWSIDRQALREIRDFLDSKIHRHPAVKDAAARSP
ncbi:MAG: hypothetical protein NTW21_24700 [Verrucomicrobia bacterium]|nr:hypothetical protein [Verrucomicrobiota bacterium]